MKAITIVKPGVVEIRDLPKPQVKSDEGCMMRTQVFVGVHDDNISPERLKTSTGMQIV